MHITTGSAGCREKHDGFLPNPPAWSAVRFDKIMIHLDNRHCMPKRGGLANGHATKAGSTAVKDILPLDVAA